MVWPVERQDFKIKEAGGFGLFLILEKIQTKQPNQKGLTQPQRQGYNYEMNKIISHNL